MAIIQVHGVQVVCLYVSDLERAKSFYIDTLGLSFAGEMPPGINLKAGDFTLYLESGRTPKTQITVSAEISVRFKCDEGMQEAFEKLSSAGVTIEEKYHAFSPDFAIFKIADPDGNLLEFSGIP